MGRYRGLRVGEYVQHGATVNLGIDVSRRGPWVVLAPLGDLDMGSAPRLRQEVVTAVSAGDVHLVLDLGAVEFIDSVGLGVIVGARRRTRANGGDIVLARVSAAVRALFELVELDRIFAVDVDLDTAIGRHP